MSEEDPFSSSADDDRTIIRPTPGKRTPPAPPTSGAFNQGFRSELQAVRQAGQSNPASQRISVSLTGTGLNPLVDAASILLTLSVQLRNTAIHPDVEGLHNHVVRLVRQFESQAQKLGADSGSILAARYVLCTYFDEVVLTTPWGSDSIWSTQTLLSTFHNETRGGEKFFQILDRVCREPSRNVHMLELIHIILSLGFKGKYAVQKRGRDRLEEIQDGLFRVLRMQKGDLERDLSPHWRGIEDRRNVLVKYVPLWIIGAISGVVLLATYTVFRLILEDSTAPAFEIFSRIGQAE